MIPIGVHEYLRLVLQTAECLRMQDAIAIALERRSPWVWFFCFLASPRVNGAGCQRREFECFPGFGVGAVAADQPAHTILDLILAETKSRVATTTAIASICTDAARYCSRLMFCWRRKPTPPPPAKPMIVDMRTLMSQR